MGRVLEQNASGNVVIGPVVNISGTLLSALTIANNQIVLIKEGSVSAARSDGTSAVSVGPGMYRIGLNATDTNTLGTLTIYVSASAALQYAIDAEVWQSTTYKLFYGSADQIATSAAVSAIVSVGVNTALVNRQVPTSAGVSGIVIQALTDYQAVTSAGLSVQLSVRAHNALVNYGVPTSAAMSAMVSAVTSAVVSGVLASYN